MIVFLTVMLSFALENTLLALSFWWLARWSNSVISNPAGAITNQSLMLGIYAALSGGAIIFTVYDTFLNCACN